MIKDDAENVVKQSNLEDLPLGLAKTVRNTTELTSDQKEKLIFIIRNWTEYVKDRKVNPQNLFVLRWHLQEFAELQLGVENEENIEVKSVNLTDVFLPNGQNVKDLITELTSGGIHEDNRVAIFGGTARIALKAYALQNGDISPRSLESEFPIADVDLIVENPEYAKLASDNYGSDLTGTKVVEDISDTESLLGDIDLTINQVLIYKGRLFYTSQAYADTASGRIKNLDQNSALFGRKTFTSLNGKRYLTAQAMYRSFSFLLRGKGDFVEISAENIEAEKDRLKKYWAVLLFVKVIPYARNKGDKVLFQWLDLARQLDLTEQTTPASLLSELREEFPELNQFGNGEDYDEEAQLRWLVGKVVKQSIKKAEGELDGPENNVKQINLSPPLKISLSENVLVDSLQAKIFWETFSDISGR